MSIETTWRRYSPKRHYTGDRVLGVPMCVLKEFPMKPIDGDTIMDYEKWQALVYKNGEWHVIALDWIK